MANTLPRVHAVTFDADRSQLRTGHRPRAMARLRNPTSTVVRPAGITNIAAAPPHPARHPNRPVTTLLTR